MNHSPLPYRPRAGASYEPSHAASEAAEVLTSNLASVENHFAGADSLHASTYREFTNNFLDTRVEGWDGYGARPASDAAFVRSERFLKQCLGRYPAPLSGTTPSGGLTFEWRVSNDRRFMVNIGPDDIISFAGLFGSGVARGAEPFVSDVPAAIWENLARLYPQ